MNFQKLLEYQSYDMKCDSLMRELKNSEENEKIVSINKQLNEAVAKIYKLNDVAGALLNEFNSIKQRLEESSRELDDLADIFEENKDLDEVDATEMEHYLKQAKKLKDRIDALEAGLKTVKAKAAAALKEYDEVRARGAKLSDMKAGAEDRFKARRMTYQSQFEELKAKMDAIRKLIPEEMAIYDRTKTAVNRAPYILEYDPKTKKCPYPLCQMDIYADTQAKLKQPGDHAECPNCGRLLFIPEQK